MTFRDARKRFSEMLRLGRAAIRLVPAALLGATLAGLILTEFLYPPASYFWSRHPVTLAIAINFLTLAVGGLIIDAVARERERRQWQHVANLGFQDLAREVMLIVRMMAELSGEADYRQRAARPMNDDAARKLHASLDEQFGELPQRQNIPRPQRLEALFRDETWGHLSYRVMQERTQDGRLTVARWAPVMVTNEPLAQVLTSVAELIRDVEIIQAPLVKTFVDGITLPSGEIEQWVLNWTEFESRCDRVHSILVPGAYLYSVARALAG